MAEKLWNVPHGEILRQRLGWAMPFKINDSVGIKPVRDTGAVDEILPSNIEYNVRRDSNQLIHLFPEDDLFLLEKNKTIRIRETHNVGPDRTFFYATKYKFRNNKRSANTTIYRLSGGHNMGRVKI